jgi:methylated-DNA-protein-cysteine methyltransferase related protein
VTSFRNSVIKVLREIPQGKVATYGQIARIIGSPRAARQVGMVLFGLRDHEAEDIAWQRVINSEGRISTYKIGHGELQRALLESEGVVFNADAKIDLAKFLWDPNSD